MDIIYANDFFAYHQITDLCYHKSKAITALIPIFVFIIVHIFNGTDKICKMIETFYDISNSRAAVLQSGFRHRANIPISTDLMLMKQGK